MLNMKSKNIFWTLLILMLSITLTGVGGPAEGAEAVREKLRFAAWNIQKLSKNKVKDDAKLNAIVGVLSKYDLIAITELIHEEALIKIRDTLNQKPLEENGKRYSYEISEKVGRPGDNDKLNNPEYYAFLYNTEVIDEVVQKIVRYPDEKDDFIRDPYWATFRAEEFDFSVIVVHLERGDGFTEPRKEVKALGRVYNHVQIKNKGENDVLLVGDFNLDPCDRDAFNSLMSLGEMEALFHWHKGHRSNAKDDQLYDNILFDKGYLKPAEYSASDIDKSKMDGISDHQPIWADFFIDGDDDVEDGKDGEYFGAEKNLIANGQIVYYLPVVRKGGKNHKYHVEGCRFLQENGNLKEKAVAISFMELPEGCYDPCQICSSE